MDHYLDAQHSYQRLLDEYLRYGSLVVAFDFDDTVHDYHQKGRTYPNVIGLLRDLKRLRCYLICWTGQEDPEFVADYLRTNDIPFDAINEHPPFRASQSRKVYANVYLDDRAGLAQVYGELSALVRQVDAMSEASQQGR